MEGQRMKLPLEEYNLPDTATYIVGVKDIKEKAALLTDLSAASSEPWKPTYEYSTMSMFAGPLNPSQVEWLLKDDRIAYVECDGK